MKIERTKQLLVHTLQNMMKTTSFDQIRVKDLCIESGIDRQTFYYHFKDKYDLIAWVYLNDFKRSSEQFDNIFCEEQFAKMLTFIDEKRNFYRNAFSGNSKATLMNLLQLYNIKYTEFHLKKAFNLPSLDTELQFAIYYHTSAWVSCIVHWICTPSSISPQEIAKLMYQNTPSPIKDSVTSYEHQFHSLY